MQKQRLRQLLVVFSLFILLVLPTAIVGYSNFSTLVNKAFGKPFKKDEGAFTVQTESSTNIAKGSQFSLKVTAATPKTLPFKDFAAFVEFDTTKVDIKSVITQNQNQFKVVAFQNGFLLYPASMAKPSTYKDLLPQTCHDAKTCDFTALSASTVSFSINGILLAELTEQQRPIKISLLGASEGASTYLWNEKIMLPVLSLGSYIKNTAPKFTSDPVIYTKSSTEYRYSVTMTDADSDPVVLSLTCPELVFCSKQQIPPEGLTLEGSDLIWRTPKPQKDPYTITIYANDGKSVTTQTFNLRVLAADTSYFACTFSPAVSVKILDYRIETPLVIVAEGSEQFASATVSLAKNGTVEKEFSYTFAAKPTSVILDQSSTPPLKYQFSEGTYTGTAVFTSTTGETFTCDLDNPTVSLLQLVRQAMQMTLQKFVDVVYAAVNVGTNNPPTFTSDPMLPASSGGSSPSVSFVYGNAYSFTLRAQDPDGDPLQYTVVTKPSWATLSISATNPTSGASSLAIQITGVPPASAAGSNLFSFSINDGLGHYITRTWVININYPNNDIPRVTITQPRSAISRIQGQNFLLGWDADDRHQLMSFGVYYTKSLSSTTLTAYNKNVAYNVRSMTINTKSIPPGDYYFVVTATDGFNPPATGRDYTALVRIVAAPKPTPTPKPTQKPAVNPTATPTITPTVTVTPTPTPTETVPAPDELSMQVTTPQNQAKIAPADFQIVATFTASSQGTMDKKDIKVILDGVDISENLVFQPATGKAITGTYLPKTLLDIGVHELSISAQDSKQKSKEVRITFTIEETTTDPGDTSNLFGFDVPNWLYTLAIIAIILIVIGFLLPIIMYFAFKRSSPEVSTMRRPVNPQPPQLRTPSAGFANPAQPPQMNPVVSQQPQFSPTIITPVVPVSATPQSQQSYVPPRTSTGSLVQPNQPVPQQQTVQPVQKTAPQISPEEALQSFVAQTPTEEKPTASVRPVAYVPTRTQPVKSEPPMTTPAYAPTQTSQVTQAPKEHTSGSMPMKKDITVPKNLPPELKRVQGPATVPNKMPTSMPRTSPIQTSSPTNIPPESPGIPK